MATASGPSAVAGHRGPPVGRVGPAQDVLEVAARSGIELLGRSLGEPLG